MSQHIGAPATPTVKPGERVRAGQKIGEAPAGLGAAVHSSIDGTVVSVSSAEVVISREQDVYSMPAPI